MGRTRVLSAAECAIFIEAVGGVASGGLSLGVGAMVDLGKPNIILFIVFPYSAKKINFYSQFPLW